MLVGKIDFDIKCRSQLVVSFSICCNAGLIMYDCSFDKFLIVLNPLVLANEYLLIFVRNCMFVCNLGTNLHYKKWLYCTDIILQAQISFSLNPYGAFDS